MRYILILFMVLCSLVCYPETLSIDKAGNLNKVLKNHNVKEMKSIKIIGTLNSSDLNVLKKLSSLGELDLRDAEFQEFKSKKTEYKFPKLSTLHTLRVSKKFAENIILDISQLGEIRNIETPSTNIFVGLTTNLIDSLIINDSGFLSHSHPIFVTPVTIKFLSKTDSGAYEPKRRPNNIDVLVYKNDDGCQAIHITNDNIDLLNQCDEINSNCIWDITNNTVDLRNIETLGANAFKGSNIKEVHLSSSIKKIDTNAFNNSNIKIVEFVEPLKIKNLKFVFPRNVTVIIPKGYYGEFSSIVKSPVFEKGKTSTQHVIVPKGKKLSEFLSDDSLFRLDTLSIEGTVPLSDLKFLERARNLRVLNLKKCKVLKDEVKLYQEKRKLACNLINELWVETLNNIYKIRDDQAEARMAYALMGYIAGKVKNNSKIEYENGNFFAIFDHYMAKSLEEDANANYKARNGISQKEQDAINDFKKNYDKVLAITGINQNLMEYLPEYVPNPDYGGNEIFVKDVDVMKRYKEIEELFKPKQKISDIKDMGLTPFLNEYDPIYWWTCTIHDGNKKFYRYSQKGLSKQSHEWRWRSFLKLRDEMENIENVPLIVEEFSFIPSLNRIIR